MGSFSPDIELGPLTGILFIFAILGIVWILIYIFPAILASLLAGAVLLLIVIILYYALKNLDRMLLRGGR